jgi:DNA modification methylase
MNIQVVKIKDIKNNPNNPRIIKDDKFKKLVASIREFPKMLEIRPIVVNDDMIVLGGNMRLKAIKELGLTEAPVIKISDLTDEQQRQFIIKDNAGFGEWDWNMLANEWETDELEKWGLDLPDFVQTELEAVEDDFEVNENTETDIVIGDLFEIGEHRLLCGDSTDSDAVATLMNGQKADMVFTDPPYGMFLDTDYKDSFGDSKFRESRNYDKVIGDNQDFNKEFINTIFSNFNETKEIFIWGADYFAELLQNKNDGSWLVWNKKTTEALQNMFGNQFELCWSKNKHKRIIYDITWSGPFGHNKQNDGEKKVHPTQKPVKLVSIFINDYLKDGTLIGDLFLGSGSTMVASHQLKRKCYGMELDPKYCQVIVDRMKKLDDSLVIKRNGVVI